MERAAHRDDRETVMPYFALIGVIASVMVFIIFIIPKGGVNEFPFFFSAIVIIWFDPQLLSLAEGQSLSDDELNRVGIMLTLVLGCVVAGWKAYRRGIENEQAAYDFYRLIIGCCFLTGVGAAATLAIGTMSDEVLSSSQWTGPVTILVFIGRCTFAALALAIYLSLRGGRAPAYALVAVNLLVLFPAVFVGFRRATIGEVVIVPIAIVWFTHRLSAPRYLYVVGCIAAALIINNVGELRSRSYSVVAGHIVKHSITLSDLMEMDWTTTIYNPSAYEVRNATKLMGYVAETGGYDYGASIWNAFVFAFVPGQLIGFDNKYALMIGEPAYESMYEAEGYMGNSGATWTGLGDSFSMFGYFGALIFFGISGMMASLYNKAERGDVWAITLYSCMIVNGMHAITHFSTHFLTMGAAYLLFTGPVFLWARSVRVETSRLARKPRISIQRDDLHRDVRRR